MANQTRAQRITKLGNAIRRYRGEYRRGQQVAGKPIVWTTPPDPSAKAGIIHWLEALNFTPLEIAATLIKIGRPTLDNSEGFKDHNEMAEFMKSLA